MILATGSRVKSLPGLTAGRRAHRHQRRRPAQSSTLPKQPDRGRRRARSASSSPASTTTSGVEVTLLEYLPGRRAAGGRARSPRSWSAPSRGAASRSSRTPASIRLPVTADEQGVCLMVGKEGEAPASCAPSRCWSPPAARCNTDNVGLETTRAKVEKGVVQVDARMRTAEPHLYAIGDIIGGLLLAHVAAHEGITAVNAIVGVEAEPRRLPQDAARHLLPAADRLDRPHAGRVRARRHPDQDRQGALPGHRQGAHRRRLRGLHQGHRPQGDRRAPGRPHDRPARHRPHRGGERRDAASRRPPGRSARPSTLTRPCRRRSARPLWPSTAGPSTSDARRPAAAGAGQQAWRHARLHRRAARPGLAAGRQRSSARTSA